MSPNLGTDNSSAATYELEVLPGRPRGYNSDYLELCTHYDLTPLTINVGCPHEQGDVESGNRHLKRRLVQHLLLRGSRDFSSVVEYDRFVAGVLRAANAPRQSRLAEELAVMRPLPAGRLPTGAASLGAAWLRRSIPNAGRVFSSRWVLSQLRDPGLVHRRVFVPIGRKQ